VDLQHIDYFPGAADVTFSAADCLLSGFQAMPDSAWSSFSPPFYRNNLPLTQIIAVPRPMKKYKYRNTDKNSQEF